MKTQTERLLEYLRAYRKINPLDAWMKLGIYRLGARIYDLKRAGHNIQTRTANVRNQFGEKCHVAEYRYDEQTKLEL